MGCLKILHCRGVRLGEGDTVSLDDSGCHDTAKFSGVLRCTATCTVLYTKVELRTKLVLIWYFVRTRAKTCLLLRLATNSSCESGKDCVTKTEFDYESQVVAEPGICGKLCW